MWRQAALGLLALSVAGNVVLYSAALKTDKLHREEAARYQEEIRYVSAVRDQAVRQLGELTANVEQEQLARREQAEAYEAMGAYEYIGECVITYYCPCVECCGRWADGLTATGIPAVPGVVAVDPEVIALGSTVVIDGQRYLAADTGVTGNHIDICVTDHAQAEDFGVQSADVWVAANG